MVTEPKAELKTALGELLAEARRDLDAHPTPDELVAYGASELTAAEAKRVEDHLVLCPHCLELLLDRERFADPAFGSEGSLTPAEEAAAWQALRSRLAADEAPREALRRGPSLGLPSPRRRWTLFLASPRPAWALAASLFVVALGLSLRTWQLQRSVDDLSRPQVNAPVVDLFPASPLRGEERQPAVVELASAGRFVTLILSPKGAPDFADYRVEILSSEGRDVWSAEGLEKDDHGSFTLVLPGGFLRPGDYRLRLYGLDGEARQFLEEFRLRVVL